MWRLLIWMWLTQQNDMGPRRYFGLPIIEWLLWLSLIGALALWLWLLYRLFAGMAAFSLVFFHHH